MQWVVDFDQQAHDGYGPVSGMHGPEGMGMPLRGYDAIAVTLRFRPAPERRWLARKFREDGHSAVPKNTLVRMSLSSTELGVPSWAIFPLSKT